MKNLNKGCDMSKTLKTTKAIILLIFGLSFAVGSILVAIYYAPNDVSNANNMNNSEQQKIYNGFN